MIHLSGFLLAVASALQAAPAAQPAQAEDERAIRQLAAQYVEEYNRGDLDAVMRRYAPDADYDMGDGQVLSGREAIRKNLKETLAAGGGAKLALDIKSIRFARNRAIETGVATLTPRESQAETSPYRAIHARQPDGTWLITHVGPDVAAEGSEAGPLEQLAWLIGSWSDAEDNVRSVCSWTKNRRFILRSFVVIAKDETELQVSEVIGWDPSDNVVRSWVFDSDGGFGQSVWGRKGEDWVISAKGVLADGGRASAVHILHPIDKDTFTWSSIDRDVDGSMLPDIDDIKLVRAETQPAADAADEPSLRRSGLSRANGRQP